MQAPKTPLLQACHKENRFLRAVADRLDIESDSSTVMGWIQTTIKSPATHPLLHGIYRNTNSASLVIHGIYRNTNSAADMQHSGEVLWTDPFFIPPPLRDILLFGCIHIIVVWVLQLMKKEKENTISPESSFTCLMASSK